ERFMNRRLFKYIDVNPNEQIHDVMRLSELFTEVGINPRYYLAIDSSSDLPYDFYRPGEEGERLPIYLLMPDQTFRELSRESDLVEAISGKRRTDHKLYFPMDMLEERLDDDQSGREIIELLEREGEVEHAEERCYIMEFVHGGE